MKVVDGKGRLFGKLNIIDCLMVLVLVAAVLAVVWKFAGGTIDTAISDEPDDVTYTVYCRGIWMNLCADPDKYIGTQLMSNGELVDAYIIDCEFVPNVETFVTADGHTVEVESTRAKDAYFTIEAHVPFTDNAYQVGSQEVRLGKSHIVKTCALELTGTTVEIEASYE